MLTLGAILGFYLRIRELLYNKERIISDRVVAGVELCIHPMVRNST
jgi:hypothetical protein